jgi:hypothetical protein
MATRNRMNVAAWLVTGVLAVAYFSVGAAMFVGWTDAMFRVWGHPQGTASMIGILAMAGAIGLLFVRTAGWSAIALMAITAGAVWIFAVDQQWTALIGLGIAFVALGGLAWARGLTWATRGVPPASEIPHT